MYIVHVVHESCRSPFLFCLRLRFLLTSRQAQNTCVLNKLNFFFLTKDKVNKLHVHLLGTCSGELAYFPTKLSHYLFVMIVYLTVLKKCKKV